MVTRSGQRKNIDLEGRVGLLEDDVDRNDVKFDKLLTKFDRLTQSVIALVISVIVATITVVFTS